MQGPVSVSLCAVDSEYCKRRGGCSYNKLWMGADSLLNAYFDSITLKDLMEQGARHPAIKQAIAAAPPRARMACPVDACGGCGAAGKAGAKASAKQKPAAGASAAAASADAE